MDNPSFNHIATLGGGCFWCLDAAFREITGIINVTSGYAAGHTPNPTYEQVTTGKTGHAEVVKFDFDSTVISYTDLLDIFWTLHDPTTLNRQGHDIGNQYRSIILYSDERQKLQAEASKAAISKLWDNPIVTEIVPLEVFYPAEDYHQNYFKNNPEQGYCQIVINPKIQHLRQKFADRLKST